jgi:hypothetical protein
MLFLRFTAFFPYECPAKRPWILENQRDNKGIRNNTRILEDWDSLLNPIPYSLNKFENLTSEQSLALRLIYVSKLYLDKETNSLDTIIRSPHNLRQIF